jgi:hypothetical protein
MANTSNQVKHNPRALCQVYFTLAKRWARFSFICKLVGFLVGVLTVLLPLVPAYAPVLVFMLAMIADWLAWRSDTNKGTAEALLRKLDGRDSFGWPISRAELSDLLMRSPSKVDKLVVAKALSEEYFASEEPPGTLRALENLQESAWWSKHLSERMRSYYLAGTCLLVAIAVLVLLVSIQTIDDKQTLSSLGRIVTSVLTLVFSLNLFRSVLGYHNFSVKAGQIEKSTENLLASQGVQESEVIKLMSEYQLARASAPLLPTWLWNRMEDELNATWKQYRRQ